MNADLFENLRLELRRSCLIVAVLAELRTEQYSYTLRKDLAEHGLAIDEGTLYPLLRRLESQGLLVSEWREEDKRNKRFYRITCFVARRRQMIWIDKSFSNSAVLTPSLLSKLDKAEMEAIFIYVNWRSVQ
jgi:PadR family transcriptional regulator PadR